MKKFRVVVNSLAYVSQTVYVDAETSEQAEDLVFENDLWNDGVWEYMGLTEQKPELNYSEEI